MDRLFGKPMASVNTSINKITAEGAEDLAEERKGGLPLRTFAKTFAPLRLGFALGGSPSELVASNAM